MAVNSEHEFEGRVSGELSGGGWWLMDWTISS